MIINLNTSPITITKNTSLIQILKEYDISDKGIAVAINNQVVPKNQWNHIAFKENDELTIIKATQGG